MRAEVNGTSLFYEQSGDGPNLVLLHGNGEDHHIFDPLAKRLSARFTVWAIDSRGHGESGPADELGYALMAADAAAFIRTLDIAPAHILGFSDGAITGLLLALERRELVGRLALLGVNLRPSDFLPEILAELEAEYRESGDPLIRLMLTEPDIPLERAAELTCPTLVIHGEHDLFHPETFQRLAEALPDAQRICMAGHDHDSYITGSDLLYDDLCAFFLPQGETGEPKNG